MEVVGGVATIVQLVQATALLAHGVYSACQNLRHAPKEFENVSKQVLWIQSHLQNCEDALNSVHPSTLTLSSKRNLRQAVTEAHLSLGELQAVCAKIQYVSSFGSRVRWTVRDRGNVTEILHRLEQSRNWLESAMQPILLAMGSETFGGVSELRNYASCASQDLTELKDLSVQISNDLAGLRLGNSLMYNRMHDLAVSQSVIATSIQTSTQVTATYTKSTASSTRPRPKRQLRAPPWQLGAWWALLGVSGKVIPSTQVSNKDYHANFELSVPFLPALNFSVNVRQQTGDPWSFQILSGTRLDVCRILSTTHSFLDACRRGDKADIRAHLLSGDGRISDRDERNWTALAHAISSESKAAVEELLNHGADVEGTVGQLQTSPLQWALWHKNLDITRLLLQRQASVDRMNMRGWNTVFFLWARLRTGEPCMLDFLNLLAEDDELDLDIADALNWTVLDRVAAVGTAKEVRRLIDLGANPYQAAEPLRWTAIHQAVFHGNFPAFEELLPRYGDTATQMIDDRGWTLLHIAASAGHKDIVRYLLKAGADPDAKTRPYKSHMPEVLFDKRCTPREVAYAQGLGREEAFLDALHEHRLSTGYVMVPSDSDSDNEEEFCEAREFAV